MTTGFWKKKKPGKHWQLLEIRGKKKTATSVHTVNLSFLNKTVLNMMHKWQSVPSRSSTFLESKELSPKPNTMCNIGIKTASATLCLQILQLHTTANFSTSSSKKAYVTLLKPEVWKLKLESCSFRWQRVFFFICLIFVSIQLILWISKSSWEADENLPFSPFLFLKKRAFFLLQKCSWRGWKDH